MEANNDARIARDRALQAVVDAEDVETARAIWRSAKKFNQRARGVTGLSARLVEGSALGGLG